jgi:hypothetical protein
LRAPEFHHDVADAVRVEDRQRRIRRVGGEAILAFAPGPDKFLGGNVAGDPVGPVGKEQRGGGPGCAASACRCRSSCYSRSERTGPGSHQPRRWTAYHLNLLSSNHSSCVQPGSLFLVNHRLGQAARKGCLT